MLYTYTKHKYNNAMKLTKHTHERGEISGLQITVVGLAVLVLGLGSFGIWSFVSYTDAKDNVDSRVAVAVAEAKKEEADVQEEKFAEREKQPLTSFKGPADYCGLAFQFPKTWSVYVERDAANGGDYVAYLNPAIIRPISAEEQYALRVKIETKSYDQVTNSYEALVKKGDLQSSNTASEGNQGTRYSGNFSKNIRGDAVVYRCRDKTITIRTDADIHKADYEKLIRTIEYNA